MSRICVLVLIQLINALFLIERESKARNHTPEQRHQFRLKYSVSIVGKIMSLLKKMKGGKRQIRDLGHASGKLYTR